MNLWESITLSAGGAAFALWIAISGVAIPGSALGTGWLLRHRSRPLRYAVLLGGVAALLAAPVLVSVGQSLSGLFAVTTEETVTVPAEQITDPLAATPSPCPLPLGGRESRAWGEPEVSQPPAAASSGDNVFGCLLIVGWAIGVAIGLFGLGRGLWKQRRAFVAEPWQPEWWTNKRRRALAAKVGLRSFPPVYRSPLAPMPMVVGLWRPRIVVPAPSPYPHPLGVGEGRVTALPLDGGEGRVREWSQPQWEAILLHEAAHIARSDPWAALAERLAIVIFWWCPLVQRLARRLNELRESICDDYALEGSCDPVAYAELLVDAAERLANLRTMPVPVGLLDSARRGLEERIARMLEEEKRPMTKLSLTAKLLGAGVLTLACLSIAAAAAFSQAPPAQKKIQIKIIIDGKEIDLSDEVIQALLAAQKQKSAAKSEIKVPEGPKDEPMGKAEKAKVPVKLERKWLLGTGVAAPTKSDPRIEDLVKQAEMIKPGSGAAVRKALQGGLMMVKPQGDNEWKFSPVETKIYWKKFAEDQAETAKRAAAAAMAQAATEAKHQTKNALKEAAKLKDAIKAQGDQQRQALEKRLDALTKELEELRREIKRSH
jgi:beta-lactamase regulating signal transducer with metallopeptidase domain